MDANVGLVQMSCSEDSDENIAKAGGYFTTAAKQGTQIFCTQELLKNLISARLRMINIINSQNI